MTIAEGVTETDAPSVGWSYARRSVGVVLLLLVLLPLYRLLDGPDAGPFARGAMDTAELSRTLLMLGTIIVLVAGIIVSRVIDASAFEARLGRLGAWLVSIPPLRFALVLAFLAAGITLAFSLIVLEGKPNLIDAMVQLLHARFLAAGHLAGPVDSFTEFWQVQNSLVTPKGWVSQYPPGFVVFLALGLKLGIPQAVGPVFAGVTVFFSALAADRLLRDDPVVARVGAIVLALSPFMIGLAGAYMNHIAAAAFFSAAVFFAVKTLDSRNFAWPVLTGLATGVVFSIRPLTAVIAAAVVAFIWMGPANRRMLERVRGLVLPTAGAVLGIIPVFVALAIYNAHFFGSPLRLGYVASQGPLVGLGFHRDPTGQMYGPVQALAYTSADLIALSLYLLETPLPAVILVGLFLIVARRLTWGERAIALWALLPVLGNVFYWHHGEFMGPRMLNEATPGWVLLTAIAAFGLVRRVSAKKMIGSYPPRSALSFTLILGWLGGVLFLGPQRLASYGGPWMASSRITLPPQRQPSLVFVHGAWTGRIVSRLLAHGMRLDSLEVAMRYNPTCEAHFFSLWYELDPAIRSHAPPPMDFNFLPHREIPKIRIANGDDIRAEPRTPMAPACLRQVASDTLGILEVASLLWEAELPESRGAGPIVVRDMGPEINARLIARYPERVPLMFYRSTKEGPPMLAPYAVGMQALWPKG
jgi:hypothetical protein